MKRMLIFALALTILFGMENLISNNALAADEMPTMQYGEFQYQEKNDSVTITKYIGAADTVTVPEQINGKPVKSIGKSAFYSNKGLIAITFPKTVNYVHDDAIYGCSNLINIYVDSSNGSYSSIDGVLVTINDTLMRYPEGRAGAYIIPDSVTRINDLAFHNCAKLTTLTIHEKVKESIDGSFAFMECSALTAFYVDRDNPYYCSIDGVLFNKDQTRLIRYPGGKIGPYVIPDSVTSIGYDAFSICVGLTQITLPNSLGKIEGDNLIYCASLQNIYVDDSHPTFSSTDGVLFDKNKKMLYRFPVARSGDYTIPATVISIDAYAFAGSELTSVTIPKSVITIGKCAFAVNTNLNAITIPDGITLIDEYAFVGCSNLTSVTIPESVKKIAPNAFELCDPSKLTLHVSPVSVALSYAKQYGYQFVVVTPPPDDIDMFPWAAGAIGDALERGIMSGSYDANGNYNFNAANPATRAEFAAALFYDLDLTNDSATAFADTTNHQYGGYIAKLAELGIMQGISPTQFAPDEFITREQIATILNRALKPAASPLDFRYTDNADISDWARDSVYAAHAAGWISGDDAGAFRPSDTATRAEVAVIFARLVQAKETL